MKLFTETKSTEKTFSVKLLQLYPSLGITISLVDSETGNHIANIGEINDEHGFILYSMVTDRLTEKGYKFNNNIFAKDGSLFVTKR
jgi:hypothetical protein